MNLYTYILLCCLLFLHSSFAQIPKSSLTFVIDDTGSMGDDISQVKYGANLVFDTVLNTNGSQIEDCILVTFNDPGPAKLLLKTRDRELFKRKLDAIVVDGGDDCPEYSMTGIQLALMESLPQSYLYVFTDASAKDEHLLEAVQNLAIKKKTQIVFLLTGKCSEDKRDIESYYKLAAATSGQVFHIHKQDIETILTYVAETVKNRKAVVATEKFPSGYGHNFSIPVGPGMGDVVIAVSGEIPKIDDITAPDGTKAEKKHIIDLPGAVVVKIPETKPGMYTAAVGSKSETSVVATASTSIHFKHGFLPVQPTSISDTATQPISGEETHLSIQLVTTDKGVTLNTAVVHDLDENVIALLPLKLIDRKQKLYTTDLFMPPNTLFKIAVKGYDAKSKSPFTNWVSPTAIEPQKPTLEKPENRMPTVQITDDLTIHAKYDKPLKISCKVNGYPKPDTIWVDEKGAILPSKESVIAAPYDFLNILEIEKVNKNSTYTCRAANTFGTTSQNVAVEVDISKEIPKINKTTVIIQRQKGEDVQIDCRVYKGYPNPKIYWNFQSFLDQRYRTLSGSKENIILKNIDESHAGNYRCVAINELGYDDHETSLIVEYPPTIRKGRSFITSLEGSGTTLTCEVQGVPKPRVDWYRNGVKIVSDRVHHIYRDNSLRFRGSRDNDGRFTCVATNYLGSANNTIQVNYLGSVSIRPPKNTKLEPKVGDDLTLPCQAVGFPKPTIRWLYYNLDHKRTPTVMRSIDPAGSLHLMRLQPHESGSYICVATNTGSSANMTYEVKVLVPPRIEETGEKSFTAVIEDLVLRIPCNATGNPKPDISWSKNDLNIAAGSAWYDVQDDGTLIIKNIDYKSGGSYVCHAKNALGSDKRVYTVLIKSYPDEKPSKTLFLEEGSSTNIQCDVPHTLFDTLRWYKDRRLLTKTELKLVNIKFSDSGTYTCRVSNFLNSASSSTIVRVGSKPSFISNTTTLINFSEKMNAYLDCESFGEPVPEVTWFFEEKKIDYDEMIYDFKMTFDNKGKYACVVSNPFGSINRTFEIVSRECLLNIAKDLPINQPLMYDIYSRDWSLYEPINGYLRIPHDQNIVLSCPSGFENIPDIEVMATCEKENLFRIDGNVYSYSELLCRQEVPFTVRKTGKQCKNEESEEIKVGYEAGDKFSEAYTVCLDKEKNAPIYAKHTLRRTLTDVGPKERSKWYKDDSLPLNLDEVYNCSIQINHISSNLGKWFHPDDKCCFKKGQLVNPLDLPAGLAQKAAFSYLNVVPQWSTCNSKNWDELEKRVRELAESSYDGLLVWTGSSGQLRLANSDGKLQDVKLEDNSYLQQNVPEYLWKVVQEPETKSSLAIVQVNIPDVSTSEAYRHMFCEDICRDVPWMKERSWRNPANGYIFCCRLDQFEKALDYTGHFEDSTDVLYGTSLIPVHSLI